MTWAGNRTRIDLGNYAYTLYAYDGDPRYRVSEINHWRVGTPDVLLGHIAYPSRDSSGNPLTMTIGSTTTTYLYDANSRLTDENSTQFAYDWVGNRNPSAHTYNAADELTISPNHQYAYDSAGNVQYEYDSSGQTLQKTYSYTPAGLLESVTHAGVQYPSEMTWDADGNRVSFTSSTGGTWQFVYDPTAGIPAVIEESGSVYYVREPNGALIVRLDGQYTNYYHFDALGSTRLLTDAYGTVTDAYTYDAWGGTSDQSGTTVQPYQFVGQLGYYFPVQDENFPLLQLGVRFYDPAETGRFTQRDPVAGSRQSRFAYCDNSPTALSDPRGLQARRPRTWECPVRRPPAACRRWPARGFWIQGWCYACLVECHEMCDHNYERPGRKWTICMDRCGREEGDVTGGAYANCLWSNFEYEIVLP